MTTPPARPRLQIRLDADAVRLGPLTVRFHRTLRLPDDGRSYPLPPSLGTFPVCRVADFADRVPEGWRANGGVFLPMHQREAMWLSFHGTALDPVALKIAAGMRNALTGEAWDERLAEDRDQDYIVAPGQPWLDGFNSGEGVIRQFIAMPLGMGYTAEGQLSGEEKFGGIQLLAFPALPGRAAPPAPPQRVYQSSEHSLADGPHASSPHASADHVITYSALPAPGAEMGLAAGGRMEQDIHPDPHGADAWDVARSARVFVHIVDAGLYEQITGTPAPATPISAKTYTEHGLPWFAEYGDAGDIAPSKELAGLKSVAEKDAEHGFSVQDDGSVDVPAHQVKRAGGPAPFSDDVG